MENRPFDYWEFPEELRLVLIIAMLEYWFLSRFRIEIEKFNPSLLNE